MKLVLARSIFAGVIGYLLAVTITAIFAFYQNNYEESFYFLNKDFSKNFILNKSGLKENLLVIDNFLASEENSSDNKYTISSFSDSQVTILRKNSEIYWRDVNIIRYIVAFSLIILMFIWFRDMRFIEKNKIFNELRGFHWGILSIIIILSLIVLNKNGIIDADPFGRVVSGLQFGVNFYVHDILVGKEGNLTIYPYNPLSLFFFQWIAVLDSDLRAIGVNLKSYSLVLFFIFISYVWLSIELSLVLRRYSNIKRGFLFLIIFFNPFGFYYAFFLGQIDIFSVALLISGSRVLMDRVKIFDVVFGILLLIVGVVLSKPQHLLILPAIVIAIFSINGSKLKNNLIAIFSMMLIGCLIFYWLYGKVPAFNYSLQTNPQADRIGWATWFQFFGDAVIINRPIAFLVIAFFVILFTLNAGSGVYAAWKVSVYCVALFTALFQSSYAHTFGISILMFPAIILMIIDSQNVGKAMIIWFSSVFLLISWGTGAVGDFGASFGYKIFSQNIIESKLFGGLSYLSILSTIEVAMYIAFAISIIFKLYRLNTLIK